MRFFRYLRNILQFLQLPSAERQVTFYAESKNAWPDLEDLVLMLLNSTTLSICYFTSDQHDPALLLQHPRYHAFNIDEGFFRNWLFENIQTDVFVMTTPDLHNYQLKRSRHPVHYIYVQHALVSLHSVYRKAAFDHFDTIFCAGPHHMTEIQMMEAYYNLPAKNLVEHGYPRLDRLLAEKQKYSAVSSIKKILIAPSWGKQGTIESGIANNIIEQLLNLDYAVTLRPHPQTWKFAPLQLNMIQKKYANHPHFHLETHIADHASLFNADYMISDWSGAALDYAFGLNKPVIFLDIPQKINHPDYELFQLEPFEKAIRNTIGVIVNYNDLIQNTVQWLAVLANAETHCKEQFSDRPTIFSLGHSAKTGTEFIKNIVKN